MIAAGLIAMAWPLAAQDLATYRREYLDELAYASRNVVALAKAMPAEKYGWRPGAGVRSVSEVYMHIATANFELLDIVGQKAPEDLYGKLELAGRARLMALEKRSAELEKTVTDKQRVASLVERSLNAVRDAMDKASAGDLDKHVDFFGKDTTARAVYLRILVHVNEHMGQSVAYARVNGIVPPWSLPAAKVE
jgi:uncharacterized damage-inducible protein DinB